MKVLNNGYIEIKTKKDAKEALQNAKNLQDEIAEVKKETGLDDLEKDLTAYKAALRDFMVRNEMEAVEGEGFHGTLVKGSGGSRWLTDDDDLTGDEPNRCRTLKLIIEEKFGESVKRKGAARRAWLKVTRRVADPEKIEAAVAEGVLDVDEISDAWIEIERKPYLRIFEDA